MLGFANRVLIALQKYCLFSFHCQDEVITEDGKLEVMTPICPFLILPIQTIHPPYVSLGTFLYLHIHSVI